MWRHSPDATNATTSKKRAAHGWVLETRHFFRQPQATVSTAAFHAATSVLVVGFSNGLFSLFELPECTPIHTLRYGERLLSMAGVAGSPPAPPPPRGVSPIS